MNKLKPRLREAIAEEVRFEPNATRKINPDNGDVLEPFRSVVKFGFQVNAKNQEEATKMILFEAEKFFSEMFE